MFSQNEMCAIMATLSVGSTQTRREVTPNDDRRPQANCHGHIMNEPDQLATVTAVEIPSRLPGVTAWITPIAVLPSGIASGVIAEMQQREVRYHPSVQALVSGRAIAVGGSTSASTKRSMSEFFLKIDRKDFDGAELTIFEADGYDGQRQPVHTLAVSA
ncbi:hypothetical protein A5766_21355 [Gordonia sp. 852002-51296_SCH5728562-b]|nr:hypothetical protein A5766_21355 [Gordonia sp. 852002-51296_SCH5728562-b]